MRLIDADILFREVEESRISNVHKQKYVAQNHENEHRHFLRMICDSETFDLDKHDLEIRADERAKTIDEFAQNLKLKTHMENRLIDILAEQLKEQK